MIKVLLGSDFPAKRNFLKSELGEVQFRQAIKVYPEDSWPDFSQFRGGDLFDQNPPLIFWNSFQLSGLEQAEAAFSALQNSAAIVFVCEKKLDSRKKISQFFDAKNSPVEVLHFDGPTSANLKFWVQTKLKDLGAKIKPAALSVFIEKVGGGDGRNSNSKFANFGKEFNADQISSELEKLAVCAGGQEISETMVADLIERKIEPDNFGLLDAATSKNKAASANLLKDFFDSGSEDEASKSIKLSGLLAEQIRAMILVKSAAEAGVSESEFISHTGWKPARLSAVKRQAEKFSEAQLSQIMEKLRQLDIELKTSGLPPKAIFTLILQQM